jgi:riboflavin biosynthesis pyrimidine reductase
VEAITFNRLLPEPGQVDALELIGALEADDSAHPDRPYLIANFVCSADGRATYKGRSGGLGDDGDRAIFHALRERVDAVLAGTTTMRMERYGRILSKAERRVRRAETGRSDEPLACTVTRSGEIPWEIPLFCDADARVVVCSPSEPHVDTEAEVMWEPLDPDDPTPLTTAMRALRRDYDVRLLLCEGGPTLFAGLLAEGLVDELFLTLAPKLAVGDPKAITTGPPLPELQPLQIRWLLERDSSLFVRYAVTS